MPTEVEDPEVDEQTAGDDSSDGLENQYDQPARRDEDRNTQQRDNDRSSPADRVREGRSAAKNAEKFDKFRSGAGSGARAGTGAAELGTGATAGTGAGAATGTGGTLATVGTGALVTEGTVAGVEAGAGFFASPPGWVTAAVIFILFLVIVFYVFFIMDAAKAAEESTDEGPQLTVQKTGPTTAKVGDILTYTISFNYPGSYDELTLIDTIPAGTEFVDVQAGQKATYNPVNRTVTWKATENTYTQSTGSFTLRLRATTDNIYIVNILEGTTIGTGGTGDGTLDLTQTTFKGLLTGQGRNTTILGDENKFVTTVVKNAPNGSDMQAKEAQIRQIYKAAVAKNVNPLLILSIWGVESGWNTGSGNSFGCVLSGDKSWAGQLNCVVNTANNRMAEFDKSAATKKPVLLPINPQPPACTYNDSFMYAFERMTPVCSMDDGNTCARQNFVNYFKTYMGTRTQIVCSPTKDKSKYNTKDWKGIDP